MTSSNVLLERLEWDSGEIRTRLPETGIIWLGHSVLTKRRREVCSWECKNPVVPCGDGDGGNVDYLQHGAPRFGPAVEVTKRLEGAQAQVVRDSPPVRRAVLVSCTKLLERNAR
jgi:hypothetical protein